MKLDTKFLQKPPRIPANGMARSKPKPKPFRPNPLAGSLYIAHLRAGPPTQVRVLYRLWFKK
jgi:hypothetical protein